MISLEEAVACDQPFYFPASNVTIPDWGPHSYASLCNFSFLMSHSDRIVRPIDSFRVGTLREGEEEYGRLRDKEVLHFNASGSLSFRSHSLVEGVDALGTRQYLMTNDVWRNAAGGLINWGESFEYQATRPGFEYTEQSVVRVALPAIGRWEVRFAGEKMLFFGQISYEGAITKNTGAVYIKPGYKYGYKTYRRGSDGIYLMSQGTGIGIQDESTWATMLASIPDAGGTRENPTSLRFRESIVQLTQDDIDLLKQKIARHLRTVPFFWKEFDPALLGDLAVECAEQLEFVHQNVLNLVFDIEDWRNFRTIWKNLTRSREWKQALRAYRRIKRGHGKPDDLVAMFTPGSSTYLFGKYAVLPTVADCKRLIDGFSSLAKDVRPQRLHSRRVTPLGAPGYASVSRLTVCTVECAPYPNGATYGIMEIVRRLKLLGLYPEIFNLWDIIPYSFVLDWIVDVGGLLDDLNTFMDQKWYFPILYCILSNKDTWSTPISSLAPEFGLSGVIEFSYYHRWISRELPLPTVRLPKVTPQGIFEHLAESSALILQKL